MLSDLCTKPIKLFFLSFRFLLLLTKNIKRYVEHVICCLMAFGLLNYFVYIPLYYFHFYCYVIFIVMYFYYYVMCSFVSLDILIVLYVPFCLFCLILLFSLLFLCKCVLYCFHRDIGEILDYPNLGFSVLFPQL
jgi:hypothetical protein